MTTEEAKRLISKYNNKQCTEAEQAFLDNWYMQLNCNETPVNQDKIEKIGEEIYKKLPGSDTNSNIIKLWSAITAIASVSLIGISILMYHSRYDITSVKQNFAQDVSPGSQKALLTLANGKIINLSEAKTGIIIDGDKISYNDGTTVSSETINDISGLATISTPIGGEYQIVLSDGTKVWLNAASTLQYQTVFRERGPRNVKLVNGEAYFEVKKDKKRPFIVATNHQDVFVLGTHFNVNTYEPGSMMTTLLEGSIRVNSHRKPNSVILKPGEQSINKDSGFAVKKVDTDLAVAWKNGKTEFRDANLKSVMKMLERWYNIEVIYNGAPMDSYYSGSVSRKRNISEVLQLLESTGEVHFKIEGRRVKILK